MERGSPEAIYQLLRDWNIPFRSIEHPEAATMEDCQAVGRRLGAPFCKNLFLANRRQTEFFLLLIGVVLLFITHNMPHSGGIQKNRPISAELWQ